MIIKNSPQKQECLLTAQVQIPPPSLWVHSHQKSLYFLSKGKRLLENKKAEVASDSFSSSPVHLTGCAIASSSKKRPDDLLSIHRKAKLDPAVCNIIIKGQNSFVRVP